MRLAMFFWVPLFEDDYHRTLWDGAVSPQGYNPYVWSPQCVLDARDAGILPTPRVTMAEHPDAPLASINHPTLRSIYPADAEFVFALAFCIRPFSPWALRVCFLGLDMATLGLILIWLARLDRPREWAGIFWPV